MLKRFILKTQKKAINGPFKRVVYIDPFPEKLLKFPTFLITNVMMLAGIIIVPVTVIIAYCGLVQKIPYEIRTDLTEQVAAVIYKQSSNIAEFYGLDRLDLFGLFVPMMLLIGISLFMVSNYMLRRKIFQKWKEKRCSSRAKVIDWEIREQIVSGGRNQDASRSKMKRKYVFRTKVEFTYGNHVYTATPSVINRLHPGAVGLCWSTRSECKKRLANFQNNPVVEFDPEEPLDCEIQGNLEELLKLDRHPLHFIIFFAIGLFAFSQISIYIVQNGG